MHDTKEYTLRFRAFAASRNQSPDEAPANYEFIRWIGHRWAEFGLNGNAPKGRHHAAFDAWLSKKYGVTA